MPLSNQAVGIVRHVQSEPAAVWTIRHAHGYPVVDVYVQNGDSVQKIVPQSIVYVNATTVEVRFSQPRAGFATVMI